jgi:hypothetical protein
VRIHAVDGLDLQTDVSVGHLAGGECHEQRRRQPKEMTGQRLVS